MYSYNVLILVIHVILDKTARSTLTDLVKSKTVRKMSDGKMFIKTLSIIFTNSEIIVESAVDPYDRLQRKSRPFHAYTSQKLPGDIDEIFQAKVKSWVKNEKGMFFRA